MAEFLVRSASAPFFQILSQWINRGIIVDHGKDFYVEDNEVRSQCSSCLWYDFEFNFNASKGDREGRPADGVLGRLLGAPLLHPRGDDSQLLAAALGHDPPVCMLNTQGDPEA